VTRIIDTRDVRRFLLGEESKLASPLAAPRLARLNQNHIC